MKKTLGVVVGRFQASHLHEGYDELFNVIDHLVDDVLVLIGTTPGSPCMVNPLDYETRLHMLQESFPNYHYEQIFDKSCDKVWSDQLDNIIHSKFPDHDVTLFSSRDGFFPHYDGIHKKQLIKMKTGTSSTIVRENVSRNPNRFVEHWPSFRVGMIHAFSKLFPTSYQCVDICVFRKVEKENLFQILLGRKNEIKGWVFPGGFVDPTDESLEFSARREAREEIGDIEISDPKYIGSYRIDNYRYRKSANKIMTAFFISEYIFGNAKAGDDLDECEWVSLDDLAMTDFCYDHQELFMELKKYVYKNDLGKDQI